MYLCEQFFILKSSNTFTSYPKLNEGSTVYEMLHEKGEDITYIVTEPLAVHKSQSFFFTSNRFVVWHMAASITTFPSLSCD